MSTTTHARKKAAPAPGRSGSSAERATGAVRLRRVFVRDLEIVGSIGVYEHEKRYEQRILISADLWVRDDYDGKSDRLADVLDYGKVVDNIVMLVESEHVNLIETLAERIARQCLSDGRVQRVRVRIEKPDVARSFKGVGIEIERGRG
jgi:7,8-dihydroneopterin aldolase/epimerase/oxygenase